MGPLSRTRCSPRNRGARGGINGTRIDNLPAGTAAIALFDAANAEDPNLDDGQPKAGAK